MDQYAVVVQNVGMVFNMASEKVNGLKEYFIKMAKRQLFFKKFVALEGISISVKKGDSFGIVGDNGSGKSTLLKIIAGVLEPTTGKATVEGVIAPLIELGAGFDPELTARENVYLNGSLLGYPKAYIEENFDAIVDFAEVGEFINVPLKNYSSGMVARIAFSIATVIVPDVLIVDETLAVGDMFFQKKCEERIRSLIENNHTTVLFVSHSIKQVERICNNAVWLDHGKIRMSGDAQAVCEAYRHSRGIVTSDDDPVD
jgi:ABC-2 type transport system ATP-binding protein